MEKSRTARFRAAGSVRTEAVLSAARRAHSPLLVVLGGNAPHASPRACNPGGPTVERQAAPFSVCTGSTAATALAEGPAQRVVPGSRTWEPGQRSCWPPRLAAAASKNGLRIYSGFGYSKEYACERLYRDRPYT